ncbi:tyrosine-protein phosphatase non-receptor type 4-like isoform X2 [Oncorhynchus masou masou]|uniref:tyrosine-protein phosphatase non-receptor type 4-like isoform X2 n=1 Tax=Oncorhynchus masou masou TaxID=90313 RepID=UPI003182C005
MTSRSRLPAGSNDNVRASELAQDRQHTEVVCNVLLLDNTVQAFKVNKHDQGQVLLDVVFKHLELTESDYFGLQLADDSSDSQAVARDQRWLDPTKPIRKQLKRGSSHRLNFRVKFFVTDPNKLQEEYTRYQYVLQIKQDILSGRLPCPNITAALLASYAVQSELGDYSQDENLPGYLSGYSFIPNAPHDFEKEIAKQHQQHKGLPPAQSEFNYLNTARTLELYGVELHYARDQSNTEILIGVMSTGIVIYKNRVRINCFPWLQIVKISFKCRQFFIQLRRELNESREALLAFNMVNYRACKNLWKDCVEHHTFFRLDRPLPPQKNFFAHVFQLGSKYRYCGRTEVQSVQYGKEKGIKDRVFARSPSKPLVRRLMDGGMDWESVSRNSRASLSDDRLETQSLPTRSPPGTPNQNSKFAQERLRPSSVGHLLDHVNYHDHASPCQTFSNHKSASSTQANSISLDSTPSPDSTIDGLPPALPPKQTRRPLSSQSHSQQELDNHINELYDTPLSEDKTMPNGVLPHDNLVFIKMCPDEQGRFGFNVKGGLDQKMPVIVSRVAPGTAADLCVPRLNEGDQVVLINGQDISEHTHDQVVMFIKASCEESDSGELNLLVRPNAVYDLVEEEKLEDGDTESNYQYSPERAPQDHPQDPPQDQPQDQDQPDHHPSCWRDSILQLKEGLSTGAVQQQFDQLYRKRPGLTMSCAKLPQNISKNRYRDISPYDATRVILRGKDGDYINANYINMVIPAARAVNRYIACQGPLPATCSDFWRMTWEQGSNMVVMLTTQVERGRVKCHQYWPNPGAIATHGDFQVSCVTEEEQSAFLVREITLTHLESEESRSLTQIQYMAWPDHGVPDDYTDFLDFVSLVRRKREGKEEPVIVHCSAGIGRTGVLITMETAMCLIECNQPVYPLDIVRTMRDQRAMMIQTPSQYRFVCEAILKVYEEEQVKPLTATEPLTPVESLTPTKPLTPVESLTPTTPLIPVESLTPTKPLTPVESLTPTKPLTPVESLTPTTPLIPVESLTPTKPLTPVESLTPTTPLIPIESLTPTTPLIPVESLTPTKPLIPVESLTPTKPLTPVESLTPTKPLIPVESLTPTKPLTPVESLMPTKPLIPVESLTPAKPLIPVESLTPTMPLTPVESLTPAKPLTAVESLTPTMPLTPVESLTPTKPLTPVESLTPTKPLIPVESLTPTKPLTPVESLTPTKPLTPVESLTPTKPLIPVESLTPTKPLTPVESLTPTKPLTPVESLTPTKPLIPVESLTPTKPLTPVESLTPTKPLIPVESLTPTKPLIPVESLTPTKPLIPVESLTPTKPLIPVESLTPTKPLTPVESLTPTKPLIPVESLTPTMPLTPVESLTPTKPLTPVESLTPTKPLIPVESLTPTKPLTPVESLTPTKPLTPVESLTPTKPLIPVESLTPTKPLTPVESLTPTKPLTPVESLTPTKPLIPVESLTPTKPLTPVESLTPTKPLIPVESLTPTKPLTTLELLTPTEPEVETERISFIPPGTD